jgi:predicted TIM-barrel fold metal-dependent hydrolase
MARAVNDWQIAEWLEPEPRLRASIVVPSRQPAMAAEEIDRVGGHPGFVQVFLPVHAKDLYGNRVYYPLFDAIAAHDLVVGLHFGGAPGYPPTASGWPSYYIEEYVGAASIFQSQILNMIVEGLFDRYPSLRVALIEGGFTWMPSLMWRMDKEWKGLRREVPWNRMLPSEYVRRHMRLTLQPLDEPPDAAAMLEVIEQLGSDDLLMFSTDYPHYHFDSPDEALPADLPDGLRRKILSENAREFYRLGSNEQ